MSFSSPLFKMAAPDQGDSGNFEEDEDDSPNTLPSAGSSPAKPFTLFTSSFITPATGDASSASSSQAGVIEGEEDEDEAPQSTPTILASSAAAPTFSSPSAPARTSLGSVQPSTEAKPTVAASASHKTRKYTKAQKQVVDMNNTLRKAPVKKLRDTFVEIRTELGPTQTSLTASVRAASEATALSNGVDERLALLSERLQGIRPLFV